MSCGSRNASAMMNSTAPIGITDCVSISGTCGRLTRWSPLSTVSTSRPVYASTPKNRNTKASAINVTTTRMRGGRALTSPGTPIWAPRKAASAAP